jgi:hypothetical protein
LGEEIPALNILYAARARATPCHVSAARWFSSICFNSLGSVLTIVVQ